MLSNLNGFGIAHIRAIFLKSQSQETDSGMMDPQIGADYFTNLRRRYEFSHIVVDQSAGCGQMGHVAGTAGFIDEVVRIDADTVATNQARREIQGVPLGIHGLDDFFRVDIHMVESAGYFIHESNIDVTLGIFDELGRFSYSKVGAL